MESIGWLFAGQMESNVLRLKNVSFSWRITSQVKNEFSVESWWSLFNIYFEIFCVGWWLFLQPNRSHVPFYGNSALLYIPWPTPYYWNVIEKKIDNINFIVFILFKKYVWQCYLWVSISSRSGFKKSLGTLWYMFIDPLKNVIASQNLWNNLFVDT